MVQHSQYGSENDHLTHAELVESIKTQCVVFRCAALGIGEITEENADEFAIRSKMYEEMNGMTMWFDKEDYSLTHEDIVRRIGLTTNVSKITDAQFHKTMVKRLRERAEYSVRSDKREAEKKIEEAVTA